MWLARAARAGFRPYPRNIEPLCASADTTRLIRIASHDGYTGLDFAGETMVANLALVQSGQSGAIVVALGTDCRDLCDIR